MGIIYIEIMIGILPHSLKLQKRLEKSQGFCYISTKTESLDAQDQQVSSALEIPKAIRIIIEVLGCRESFHIVPA